MDLTSKSAVRNLFKTYDLRPKKWLGQNFLIDKRVLKKITEAADLKPSDVVLEIGPGIGTMTIELAKRVKKVVAVEKDSRMAGILHGLLKCCNVENVKIVNADILRLSTKYKIQNTKYKVVANLPYCIASPTIRKFLEAPHQPELMVLMVQKEVGQRICAKPPRMNMLAVSVQFYAEPEIISYIPKTSFWPQPKVNAAIVKITPHKAAPHQCLQHDAGLREQFFEFVRSGFSQPRKQILNNLSNGLKLDKEKIKSWLSENNIRPAQRAETLSVEDWIKISQSFKENYEN
jgi:16S rRNA (adenine1518-N6/adenine1519-N6)-dimethyltransferase